MKIKDLPEEFVTMYNLTSKAATNGFVYIIIQKGMYGLPQAGILAQELLEQRLNKHGYRKSPITPGLWGHDYRPISFTLCVDDFGIKYIGHEHADHLASILSEHYKCSHDWDGQRYLGMTINWDYTGRVVHVSMLDHIPETLTRFQHPTPCIASLSINRTPMSNQPTAQKPNTRTMWTHPRLLTNRAKNTSKRSSALCSTMHAASTAPCYQH
jgi:hypothetical protein